MENDKTKKELLAWGMLILGSLLFAAGDVMFSNPYHLAPGGTWGLSNVINALAPWKVSLYAVCMDIPLLLIGTWILGPKFGIKTVASTIMIFVFAYLIEMTWGYHPVIQQGIFDSLSSLPEGMQAMKDNFLVEVPYSVGGNLFGKGGHDEVFYFMPDYLLNAVVAGLIYGLAIGLIFKSGATSGGSDIISMILHKYTKISLGTLVIIVDGIITFSTMFVNQSGATTVEAFTANLRLPLCSFIVVFLEGILIDLVVDGFKNYRTAFIITHNPEPIRDYIVNELHRTGSIVNGVGMRHGKEDKVLYSTLNRSELTKLRSKLHKLDPNAHMNVMNSTELLGEGFKPLPEEDE